MLPPSPVLHVRVHAGEVGRGVVVRVEALWEACRSCRAQLAGDAPPPLSIL
jgi:hypothetical protein